MSFFDKIKAFLDKGSSNEEIMKVVSKKKISIDEIDVEFNKFLEVREKRNSELLIKTKNMISSFSKDVENSISLLKKVDIQEKKVEERLKSVVFENFQLYISMFERLVYNINKIDESNFKAFLDKFAHLVNEFISKSHVPFEKANILIGKEIIDSKKLTKDLKNNISLIYDENRSFFEQEHIINRGLALLGDLKQNKLFLAEIDSNLKNYCEKLDLVDKKYGYVKQELENIKNSKSYLEYIKENELKSAKLEKDISEIKKKINFKILAKIFHTDKKKNEIVKNYSYNFKNALKEDENLEIINLVRDAQNLDLNEIKNIKLQVVDSNSFSKGYIELDSVQKEITLLESSIHSLNEEISREKKKREKVLSSLEDMRNQLKELSVSLFSDIEVID